MANTAQFESDVKKILQAVGGEENVSVATHCITRLRFVLKNDKIVDEVALKNIDLVKGHFNRCGWASSIFINIS